jgi:hypothetical protein
MNLKGNSSEELAKTKTEYDVRAACAAARATPGFGAPRLPAAAAAQLSVGA